MIFTFLVRHLAPVLFSVAIATVLSSCATDVRRAEPDNLTWPLPPNPPRIKYLQSIYSEDDIGRDYSLKERLFGVSYVAFISRPYGVFARNGRIYETDLALKAVFLFDLTSKRLSILGGEGAMQIPSAVVSDKSGVVYVADAGNSRISLYDAQGVYRTAYLLDGSRPVALALDETRGRLYVADRQNHTIIVLGLDGKLLFSFGGPGEGDGQFNIPLGIAQDPAGTLWILDSGNFRVQRFDPEGTFLSRFGTVGDRPGMFANPKGIATDSDGHIYVTDAAFNNFQIFDAEGRILLYVGGLGPLPGQFHLPGGIAIDESDRIYIADQFNRRIEVFQYLKAP